MVRIKLDTAVPDFPLTSFAWSQSTGDLSIAFDDKIYILVGKIVVCSAYFLGA